MRTLLAMALALAPAAVQAGPVGTPSNEPIPAPLKAEFDRARELCRNAVYRYYADRPLGPQRNFSIQDIDIKVNPILSKRLLTSPTTEAAVRSAGTSFIWKVKTKNANGYCDLPPTARTLIKAEPFFEQFEQQPRIVISH
jgi:hypothetical protein